MKFLDNQKVNNITSYLDSSKDLGNPTKLISNKDIGFVGSKIYGQGFLISYEEKDSLIQSDEKNADVLYPYLIGADLNKFPDQRYRKIHHCLNKHNRYAECHTVFHPVCNGDGRTQTNRHTEYRVISEHSVFN